MFTYYRDEDVEFIESTMKVPKIYYRESNHINLLWLENPVLILSQYERHKYLIVQRNEQTSMRYFDSQYFSEILYLSK